MDLESDAVPFTHKLLDLQTFGYLSGEANPYQNKAQLIFQQFLARKAALEANQEKKAAKQSKVSESKVSNVTGGTQL